MTEITGPADEHWAAERKKRHAAFVERGKAKLREALSHAKTGRIAVSHKDLEILFETLLNHMLEDHPGEAEPEAPALEPAPPAEPPEEKKEAAE